MVRVAVFTRGIQAILVGLVFSSAAHAAALGQEDLDSGRALPFYKSSQDAVEQHFIDVAKKRRLAERMSDEVNSTILLRQNVSIGFESCGRVNTFYSPQRQAIVFCSEFVHLIVSTAHADRETMNLPKDQYNRRIEGVIWGIFLHELAHAIIHIDNVPVTGREEDVADQFSVWYAVNFTNQDNLATIAPSVWFWRRLALRRDVPSMTAEQRRQFMANEHSLDEQRIYNLACWYLGTGKEGGKAVARMVALPDERAQRCGGEYAEVDQGMRYAFKKYFKARSL